VFFQEEINESLLHEDSQYTAYVNIAVYINIALSVLK